MLVDLGRHDLGRVSHLGSVAVEEYRNVLRFSRIMHIGSTVTGQLAEGKDAVDVMDSILPAGTLSGAPKLRACQIIQDLEGAKRGIYGGAIGYLDFTGNLDTCIGIRLVYKKNGRVCAVSYTHLDVYKRQVVHHLRSKSRSQWQGSLDRSSARLLNPLCSLPRPWQDAGFVSNVTMINSALHLCKISLAKLASAIRETMRICGRQKLG